MRETITIYNDVYEAEATAQIKINGIYRNVYLSLQEIAPTTSETIDYDNVIVSEALFDEDVPSGMAKNIGQSLENKPLWELEQANIFKDEIDINALHWDYAETTFKEIDDWRVTNLYD